MIGQTVSHYRITGKLGEGGMGVVFKAHDTRLDRTVALKFLAASLADSERRRFVAEAQAAARVHHPNICPIYEISEHEGRLFFAMALVEGRTVRQIVGDGVVEPDAALDIAIQVASALDAAHRQGVVHRDIKGANIVVDAEGHAWILDFGIALRQDTDRLTTPGGAVGTPAYMSPEQAQGRTVDHRTDIWSLGVVLYEMLTGRLPFQKDSQYNMLHAIVTEDAPRVSTLRPGISELIGPCIEKAIAKDAAKRWQSAGEFAAELRRIRGNLAAPVRAETRTLTGLVTHAPPPPPGLLRRALLPVFASLTFLGLSYLAYRSKGSNQTLPDEKRIAVLPLTVVGDDPQVRTLADGLVETLTSKLSQIEEFQGKLMVVPASEIRNRKIASAEDARRIYAANLVLSGSAQRWSERLQFTLNLIDTGAVRQLASRTFEFDASKPIALRDAAVNGAVGLLAIRLSPESSNSLSSGETSTPAAYAEYLQGRGYLARYDLAGNVDRAIASFTNATRMDPRYALAFAALGQAHWRKAKMQTDPKAFQMATADVKMAIQLDPRSVDSLVTLGEIYSETGHPTEAIEQARAALRIAPNNGDAYRVLGAAFAASQQFDKAEAAYREAVTRKPADWYGHFQLGLFYSDRGRDNDAREAWEVARRLTPDNEVVYRNLATLAIREGDFRQASELISKAIRFAPSPRTYITLGMAYYFQRRYDEAAAALKTGLGLSQNDYVLWGALGTVNRHLPGKEAESQSNFQKAIEVANRSLQMAQQNPNTHANLAEYWAKLGNRARALAEIEKIPAASRARLIERIVVVYELTGNRQKAVAAVKSLLPGDPLLTLIRSDPDLDALWRDPGLASTH